MNQEVFIGIDIATENIRAVALDISGQIKVRASAKLAPVLSAGEKSLTQDPLSWVTAVTSVLTQVATKCAQDNLTPKALSISATSGTFVITDTDAKPIADACMYNDGRASSILGRAEIIINASKTNGPYLFANTPEFVIAILSSTPLARLATDSSHGLKIGVNLQKLSWSEQVVEKAKNLNITLPRLVAPGTKIANISKQMSNLIGVKEIPIYAGMTDGCTAQISAGGVSGSVTSLGTTMVIKAVSESNIKGDAFYSHLLPKEKFLAGGACNIGGISYKKYAPEIDSWNKKAELFGPATITTYPLPAVGERFPFLAPDMENLIDGTPQNESDLFRAILEAIAFTERYSYELLTKAGANISPEIFTVGGGGKSKVLTQIRATVMDKPIITMPNSGSDIGAAYLAIAADMGVDGSDLSENLAKINIPQGEKVFPSPMQKQALELNYQKFLELTSKYRK